MKFIYLAIVTALLGLVWRMAEGSGPATPGGPAAAHDMPAGAVTIEIVTPETNTFFATDEYHQNYYDVENSGCSLCGIFPPPAFEVPDLKK